MEVDSYMKQIEQYAIAEIKSIRRLYVFWTELFRLWMEKGIILQL